MQYDHVAMCLLRLPCSCCFDISCLWYHIVVWRRGKSFSSEPYVFVFWPKSHPHCWIDQVYLGIKVVYSQSVVFHRAIFRYHQSNVRYFPYRYYLDINILLNRPVVARTSKYVHILQYSVILLTVFTHTDATLSNTVRFDLILLHVSMFDVG